MKPLFIISSVIFSILLVFLVVYNVAFKKNQALKKDTSGSTLSSDVKDKGGDGALDTKAGSTKSDADIEKLYGTRFTKLTKTPVLSPIAAADGLIRLVSDAGFPMEMHEDGRFSKNLRDAAIPNITSVNWQPNGKEALIEQKLGTTRTFTLHNFETGIEKSLKDNLDAITWSNLGNQIFYKYYDVTSGVRSLNVANADGSNWKELTQIPFHYMSLLPVPQSALISYWNTASAHEETQFFTVGISGTTPRKIFSGRFGADYSWSPDGKTLLISSSDAKASKRLFLGIANTDGGEFKNLAIPTFVSKTVWSKNNTTVYYALPSNIDENAILPNDYDSGAIKTHDTFWKVDVKTGKTTRLVDLSDIPERFDASHLFLSESEDLLFFINRHDGLLYRLDL